MKFFEGVNELVYNFLLFFIVWVRVDKVLDGFEFEHDNDLIIIVFVVDGGLFKYFNDVLVFEFIVTEFKAECYFWLFRRFSGVFSFGWFFPRDASPRRLLGDFSDFDGEIDVFDAAELRFLLKIGLEQINDLFV